MRIPSRFLRTAFGALALIALALPSGDAFAKKEKKSGGADTVEITFEETGIASFDEVFNKASDLNQRLVTSQTELKGLNDAIATALGLTEGTPVNDALSQLKTDAAGMLSVSMDGMTPKVEVTNPDAPDNVKAGIDAVNAAAAAIPNIIEALKAIPDDGMAIVEAAKALPAQVTTEIQSAGLTGPDALKLPGKVKNNVKNVGMIPTTATAVLGEATNTLEAIKGLAG